MKLKIYLREWFYNAGIVGMTRILEKEEKEQEFNIKSNCIEIETESLKNFHIYYFNYFFNCYNIAKKMKQRMEKSFKSIQFIFETPSIEKEDIKRQQDKLKQEKKYIKAVIKSQLDKIKKFNEEVYEEILKEYNRIEEIKGKEEIEILEEIYNKIYEKLNKKEINERLTLNLFKSILSNRYFGQISFLNVVKNSASYEEQQNIFYQDYISNIVENGFLMDWCNADNTVEELQNHINEELILTKEMQKIYNDINKKYIEKQKTKEEIKQYIQNLFTSCSFCENESCVTGNYTEGNFIPLAVSSDNMKNFFWNQNAKFPICDLCKLILFCIPVGVTSIIKTEKENENGKVVYKEKEVYSFINYDTSVKELLKTNNYFSSRSKLDKTIENPYESLLLDMLQQESKISNWQLSNIFFVEFESEYLAYSRLEYFSIPKPVAIYFRDYAKNNLEKIKNYKYKLQIMDYILKNKNMLNMVNDRLKEQLVNKTNYGYESYLTTKISMNLNTLKKEGINLEEEIKKNNSKLHVLYALGLQIHEELKKDKSENKLDGYIYKMLNCIRIGKKNEFINITIKLLMAMGKDVPEFLVKEDITLSWQEKGHSFISGLLSNQFEKTNNKEEVKNNEE